MSITDFGAEIEALSTNLAAAHVSMGTFPTKVSAADEVQPIAVRAFVNGLTNATIRFFFESQEPHVDDEGNFRCARM